MSIHKIVIIEDEPPAARRLEKMLQRTNPNIECLAKIESISSARKFFENAPEIDLIFMDIQLADGISFEIFSYCEIKAPIVFTTAYDDYMLQAFKVNSIDYLLKPIDQEDLNKAFEQYQSYTHQHTPLSHSTISQLLSSIQQKSYKERFLIKSGQHLSVIQIAEIAYFFSEDGYVQLVTKENKKHLIEYNLDQLLEMIDPKVFFKINRKFILNIDCINKINSYFNSRLKLSLKPNCPAEVIVSRERVSDFKQWLDR